MHKLDIHKSALKQRGSLTCWVSDEVIEQWRNEQKTGQKRASNYYNDIASTFLFFQFLNEIIELFLRILNLENIKAISLNDKNCQNESDCHFAKPPLFLE
ncbi:MAG: transposase [Nostoc sp. NMS4]|nr:transposase [Nostoc sp. NMS4]